MHVIINNAIPLHDFVTKSSANVELGGDCLKVTSSLFEGAVNLSYDHPKRDFEEFFRSSKQFARMRTIFNLKTRVLAQRRDKSHRKLTRKQALIAWNVVKLLDNQQHEDEVSFISNGFAHVEDYIDEIGDMLDATSSDKCRLKALFVRSGVAFKFPDPIETFHRTFLPKIVEIAGKQTAREAA